MKTKKNYTTIYTHQGDFIQIPTPKTEPAIGEIITVDLGRKAFRPAVRSPFWQLASAAAVLLLVLSLTLFNALSAPQAAAASVLLNYGPSIELQVDKEAKVIKVQNPANNSDALSSLAKELQGMDIYQAVNRVLVNAQSNHLLAKDNNLVLASILPLTSSSTSVVTADKLRSSMRAEMSKNNMFGDLMVADVDKSIQQKAARLGLNINNYLIYSKFAQINKSADPSTFSTDNIPKILSEASVSVESLYPQESCRIKPPDSTNSPNMPMEENADKMPQQSPNATMPNSGGMFNSNNNSPAQPKTSIPNTPSLGSGSNSMMPKSGSVFNSDNNSPAQPETSAPNTPSMGNGAGMNSMNNMK